MNRLTPFLLILVLLSLGGCDTTGTRQRLNCITLIDYSGSLPEATLHRYVEIISTDVLRRMGQNDRLVVLPIDEGAKTEAIKLVNEDLEEKKFTYPSDGYAHAKDSLVLRLRQYANEAAPRVAAQLLREKELRQKFTYFTDIFAAIEQAAGLLEHNDPDSFWPKVQRFITGKKRIESTNVLLIFSDMIQESGECSFADSTGSTPEKLHAVLEKLRIANRIPNLKGCTVFVDGRTAKTNEEVDDIKAFWTDYFKDAGAQLAAYDYDAGSQITAYLNQRLLASQ